MEEIDLDPRFSDSVLQCSYFHSISEGVNRSGEE